MKLIQQFKEEVRAELSKKAFYQNDKFSLENMSRLPVPVKRYIEYCGYTGKQNMYNAFLKWEKAYLKFSSEKDWNEIRCIQFNFTDEPARIVYMKANMARIISFEGRDKFQDGHGNMLIKLMRFIKFQDVKGYEMDISALVTVLAETLLVPSYALKKYIHWEDLGALSSRATINHNGLEASGIFHFNEKGEFVKFTTKDRFQSQKDGSNIKRDWFITADEYKEFGGIKYPSYLTANWVTPDSDYTYFKGNIEKVDFNIGKEIFNNL